MSDYKVLAFIGQHIGEDIVWLRATQNYNSVYPNDNIHFHTMTNRSASGIAWNLGYAYNYGAEDDDQISEIEQVVEQIRPELVLDLHTEQFRDYNKPSSIYVIPSAIGPIEELIKNCPNYNSIAMTTNETTTLGWGMQRFPEIKSYVIEFCFGGLEPTEDNIRVIRNNYKRNERAQKDIEAFRKQIFEHPEFENDVITARDFIHFLYELNNPNKA
ncbi:MAG: hypothetical protein HY831_02940 [Candidatus Aenigmarchaeota archaeon]|nr:hypothetical protein [Candidatus Aenigmarchaeota archaeon]